MLYKYTQGNNKTKWLKQGIKDGALAPGVRRMLITLSPQGNLARLLINREVVGCFATCRQLSAFSQRYQRWRVSAPKGRKMALRYQGAEAGYKGAKYISFLKYIRLGANAPAKAPFFLKKKPSLALARVVIGAKAPSKISKISLILRCNMASLSLPDIESYLIKNLDFKKKNIGAYAPQAHSQVTSSFRDSSIGSSASRTQSSVTKEEKELASGNNGAFSAKITPNEKKEKKENKSKQPAQAQLFEKEKDDRKMRETTAPNRDSLAGYPIMGNHIHSYRKKKIFQNPAGEGLVISHASANQPDLMRKLSNENHRDSFDGGDRSSNGENSPSFGLLKRKEKNDRGGHRFQVDLEEKTATESNMLAPKRGSFQLSAKGITTRASAKDGFFKKKPMALQRIGALAPPKEERLLRLNRIWLGHSVLQPTEALFVDKSLRLDKFKKISKKKQEELIQNIKVPFEESLLSNNLNKVSKKLDDFYNTLKFQIIKNRKGIRHAQGLPSNGQRTKTNRQSSKIMKKKVSFVKKYLKYL